MEQNWVRCVLPLELLPFLCGLPCSYPSGSDGGPLGSFLVKPRLRLGHWKNTKEDLSVVLVLDHLSLTSLG